MKNIKKVLGITGVIIGFIFIVLLAKAMFIAPEQPEPPKHLSAVIIDNIKANHADWKLTETTDSIKRIVRDVLENNKCNIKIILTSSSWTRPFGYLISPDSIKFDEEETYHIFTAYDEVIREAEQHQADSIYAFQEKVKMAREQLIIAKFCK